MTGGREQWHLSKNVPIAIILAMFIQFGGAIWFFAQMDSRITLNTRDVANVQSAVKLIDERSRRQDVSLSRIEESLRGVRALLQQLAGDLRLRE